jgi:mRNA-degrading endonuclease toxin of MazEF toxin-antitoxin module
MKIGDVVWVEFPPGAGRAQAGRRPAIVNVALVFQLTVLDRRFLGQQRGTISADFMANIWAALNEITGRSG